MTDEQRAKLQERLLGLIMQLSQAEDDKKHSNAGFNELIKSLKEKIWCFSNAIKYRNMQSLPEDEQQ